MPAVIRKLIEQDRDVHYAGSGRVLPNDHESSKGLSNAQLSVLREIRFAGSTVSDSWRMEYKDVIRSLVRRGMVEEFAFAGEGAGSTGWSYHLTEYGMRQLLQADKGMPSQAKNLVAVLSEVVKAVI